MLENQRLAENHGKLWKIKPTCAIGIEFSTSYLPDLRVKLLGHCRTELIECPLYFVLLRLFMNPKKARNLKLPVNNKNIDEKS